MSTITKDVLLPEDNEAEFYAPPDGAADPRSLGFAGPAPSMVSGSISPARFLIRMTPGPISLPKGAPIDFTVHIKALGDFTAECPLVLSLEPVVGNGTAAFAKAQDPAITITGEQAFITLKASDPAVKAVIHTDYPAHWWAGTSKCVVRAVETRPAAGDVPSQVFEQYVEANILVSDRVPAAWRREVK